MNIIKFYITALLILFLGAEVSQAQLTIYSGRSKALVEPLINEFEQETGIQVRVRYGGTTQLAVAIMEEGRRSPADIFWAQDAGALGEVNRAGRLAELPEELLDRMPKQFQNSDGTWVATSGRARVLAFNTRNISQDDLPTRIEDLTNPKWRGLIGWAPSNASFQSFVTAMRQLNGEEETRQWLLDMKANRVVSYNNNTSILQALAAGEIQIGITNHYYLNRFKEADSNFPVDQVFFEKGNSGNLVNVAGIGILETSRNKEQALKFVEFMLSDRAQSYFLSEVYEYPVILGIENQDDRLREVLEVTPDIDLDLLRDLSNTLNLLRETGLL